MILADHQMDGLMYCNSGKFLELVRKLPTIVFAKSFHMSISYGIKFSGAVEVISQ